MPILNPVARLRRENLIRPGQSRAELLKRAKAIKAPAFHVNWSDEALIKYLEKRNG